jgi:hypothetical protein
LSTTSVPPAPAPAEGAAPSSPSSTFLGDPSSEVPTWKGVKRFYETVSVAPSAGSVGDAYPTLAARARALGDVGGGARSSLSRTVAQPAWRVLIDGRELRTGALNTLALPTQALALAVAGEFAAQVRCVVAVLRSRGGARWWRLG